MTNYKEILRLHSLGINNTRIAESCGRARSTVIAALQRAAEQELSWNKIKNCSTEEVARKLYPSTALGQHYKMPDYEWVHRDRRALSLGMDYKEYRRPNAARAGSKSSSRPSTAASSQEGLR